MRISDWSSDVCSSDLGRALALTATETGTANAIHGHGRRRPWAVIGDGGRSSLRMRYDFPAGEEGWPFAYTADQTVGIAEEALSVTLAVENRSAAEIPVGLGTHPSLPRTPAMGPWFSASRAWPPVDGKSSVWGKG